jgi:MFS family permease
MNHIVAVTLAGFSKNYASLVVCRIFIGIFEAGMFPGCLFLIGSWYRRHELLTRMAWFMVANDVAGTFSGLLGAGLGSMDGIAGYSGWSWIFFLEGGITCAAAVLAFLYIPPFPEDCTFLEPQEKEWLLQRLRNDGMRSGMHDDKMTLKGVLNALSDWKVLSAGSLYLAVCVTAYSLSVFMPSILKTFGWSDLKSNLLSAPVRVASGIVSVLVGMVSDKTKRRGIFCLVGFSISMMGNFIVMLVASGPIRYMGLYFAAIGIYICQPLVIAWW